MISVGNRIPTQNQTPIHQTIMMLQKTINRVQAS